MKNRFLFILIMSIVTSYSYAQDGNFWTTATSPSTARVAESTSEKGHNYSLDFQGLKSALSQAPKRSSLSKTEDLVVSFPTSGGEIRRFSVKESSVLPLELSNKYPGIASYSGRGIDNPTATIRFSVSDYNGVVGVILDQEKTTFIKPLEGSPEIYQVYDDLSGVFQFECKTSKLGEKVEITTSPVHNKNSSARATGPNLRTFRIAILTTPAYGDYIGGTGTLQQRKANVLAQINSTLTLINAIYERDISVILQLIPNNDQIIFFSDHLPPNSSYQDNINTIIGYGNYEIGHTLDKFIDGEHGPYEGNAGCIGCMCTEDKGLGYSGGVYPESPIFALVVAHEFGHQMGAYHVQSSANCISGNGKSEVEPGSGSTIMGYGGICPPNVVQEPQPYFNQINIRQIDAYVYSLPCGTSIDIGNGAPTAAAGADYIIPKLTPFVLTGQGSDPNGDALTYTWEQNDPEQYSYRIDPIIGVVTDDRHLDSNYPTDLKATGPMFRSFPPSSSPARYLPNIQTVRNDGPYFFEVLPDVGRVLNFVLTVRDNHPGGGRVQFDSMKVTIAANAGPFKFSEFFNQYSWPAGSSQTIVWEVGGTNTAPVNCQNVKISLSLDGGYSFPYVLAASTPNDGSHSVTVPSNISSTRCRLKIEAVNNIFYTLSNRDFSITTGGCITTVPDSLFVMRLGTQYTTLAWIRGNNSKYEIRYRKQGTGSWSTEQVADQPGNYIVSDVINNLSASTTYEAQVRSLCDGGNTIIVRARGVTGQEHINVKVNNNVIGSVTLTTGYQNYTFQTTQNGGILVQYDNDQGNRDVQVDYIEVNGEIRQAEDQSFNTGVYANGQCGGGSNSEWLHCNGSIGFDNINRNNITIRARGVTGQEHINLKINNTVVANYTLSTTFQNYTSTFSNTGGITLEYDNDQANRDVIVDYILVNGEIRQAEEQSYNTAAYANGQCGGGSYTEWMHCNGLIGFGNINLPGSGSSGWSDLLTFNVTPSQYHLDDINTLLGIDRINDTNNMIDWATNPDPGTWQGVTWTTTTPKRVTKLDINGNRLTGDLSAAALPALQDLSVGNNDITSLYINGDAAITKLDIGWTQLTELDISTQTNLTNLFAKFTLIQNIDMGSINQLEEATFVNSQLKSIDLSNQSNLRIIDLQGNNLSSLDVRNCTDLERLTCKKNRLTNLQISGLPNLTNLDASSNFITSLNVSNLAVIQHLNLDLNDLTSFTGLSSRGTLLTLHINDNDFTSINLSGLSGLKTFSAEYNELSTINNINNLTSIENFWVSGNNLTGLNLSSLSTVKDVDAYDNNLSSVTLPSSSSLTNLDIHENNLSQLNLNAQNALAILVAYDNNITNLNLGSLSALQIAEASNNNLTSITLPTSSVLRELYVSSNALTDLNLVGQNSLMLLIADDNKLRNLITMGHALTGGGAGLSYNNLPFTQLIKVSDAAALRLDPMNEIFDPVSSMTNITINYSAESVVEGQTTTFRWYKNGQLASTNTTGTFTTTGNGTYYCEMENGHFPGLVLTSATTSIGSSSLMASSPTISKAYSSNILVYPNPATQALVVRLPDEYPSNITLYTLLGSPVLNRTGVKSEETMFDVSGVGPGIYILKIATSDGTYEKRIVIQK